KRNAGGKPATGGPHDDDIGLEGKPCQLLDDLHTDRALTGNNQRVVIGWHERCATFRHDFFGNSRAIFAIAIVRHNFSTKCERTLTFGPRRIARHYDRGTHAKQARRSCYTLSVVAAGVGHHSGGPAFRRYRGNFVVGTAELE